MKAKCLRIDATLVAGLVFASLTATAQQNAPQAGHVESLTIERDKEKEDDVAKLFEGIRAGAKLVQLHRIRHRPDLEQGVCTSALTNQPPKSVAAFYITTDPESITPELMRVAAFSKRTPDNKPWYARYSVAVWRAKDLKQEKVSYQVGINLYVDALGEFVDCHFTDDVCYCGNWKKSIARLCRGK